METISVSFDTLAFLDLTLAPGRRTLTRAGRPVAIGGRAFDLLALLASHPGQVLSNRTLMQGVWPGLVVEDVNVRAQVKCLRKLLGGGADCPWIVNVTGRGYCFTAPVTRLPGLALPASAAAYQAPASCAVERMSA